MEKLLRKTLPGGRFSNVPEVRSRAMSAIRGKNNRSTEIRFRMALVRAGISGWSVHENLPGRPDIYFSGARIAIFLDGCFWHGCARCGHVPKTNSLFWSTKILRNRARDQRNSRLVRKEGIKVIRVWEHTLAKPGNLRKVLQEIQTLLNNPKSD